MLGSSVVIGLVAGVAMWLGASRRYDDAVAELAPAPIGCDTTLEFDRDRHVHVFVETTGSHRRHRRRLRRPMPASYDVDAVRPR